MLDIMKEPLVKMIPKEGNVFCFFPLYNRKGIQPYTLHP